MVVEVVRGGVCCRSRSVVCSRHPSDGLFSTSESPAQVFS